MVWPERGLEALGRVLGVRDGGAARVGRRVKVLRGEGDVVRGVPVCGADFEGEGLEEEGVYNGYYCCALGDC